MGGVICRIGMLSLVILCLHLLDLEVPFRDLLGIPMGYPSIIFDIIFCLIGVLIIGQIKFFRSLFGISNNMLPIFYSRKNG